MSPRKIISVVCLALYMVMFVHTITEHVHHHDEDTTHYTEAHNHHCSQQEGDQISLDDENKIDFYLADIESPDIIFDFFSLQYEGVAILDSTPYLTDDRVPLPEDEVFSRIFALRAPPVCA